MQNQERNQALANNFVLKEQAAPPAEIQSLNLHPEGNKNAAPIINLNSSKALMLEFDRLGTATHQFIIAFSHREKNWEESPIAPNNYMGSFFETTFSNGRRSNTQNPGYFHYSYSFPNQRIQITKSGNYLLSVSDYDSGKLLFRIPFFVSENKGKLQTRIQSLFAQRQDGRTVAQPFSVFQYPKFVMQPQFDLSFSYVQNQFWGRARSSKFFDTSTPGEVHFHLARDESFIADYEFDVLDLRSFRPDGRQIIDWKPGETPPAITLRRDVQQFNKTVNRYPGTIGGPRNQLQAQYGDVHFTLEPSKKITTGEQIFLVGDFNNWIIDQQFRMQFDSTADQWKGHALIKQGMYAYKYVLIDNQEVNDLALDRSFTNARQEYITFVYFEDPDQKFDRLLQVKRIIN